MAATAAATHGSITALVVGGTVCGSAGPRSTSHQLCYCKCFRTAASSYYLTTGCNNCRPTTTCRMRPRNPSFYQKKAQAKKVSRERSSVDTESTSVDDVKDVPHNDVGPDSDLARSDIVEHVSPVSNGGAITMIDLKEENNSSHGAEPVEILTMQSLKQGKADNERRSSVGIVDDLMSKVKDAERNILMLNQARVQALEELEETRNEKVVLQGQVNVLQTRLAEADAKFKLASQDKAKIKLLEDEMEFLQNRLAEAAEIHQELDQLKTEYKILQENAESLKTTLIESQGAEVELESIKAENQSFQEEIKSLKLGLTGLEAKNELRQQWGSEKASSQSFSSELKSKLALADANAAELARVKEESKKLLDKVQKLEADLANVPAEKIPRSDDSIQMQKLQKKIGQLQSALSQLEVENKVLEQAQAENKALREQVKMLEQRLLESDAEISSQLELYQAEMEAFEGSLEQLKLEKGATVQEESADDLPWEFWSHLLLTIDGWMLEKQLTFEDATELREMAWRRDRRIKEVVLSSKGVQEHDLMKGFMELIKTKQRPGLHIVHIAAEMAPVAKVGGLGDVVTGLGKTFQKKGHLVEVVLPKYDCMDYSRIKNLKVLDVEFSSFFDGHMHKNKIWLGTVEGLPVYFIEPHHPGRLFWRGQVYGERDDFRRFTYFCRAALEFLLQASKKPDIIHCHDWHTAAVAPLYWDIYVPQGLNSARIAFTCHNFEYQGTESAGALAACGLNVQQQCRPDRMQDNFAHDRINLLKGGIVFSNIVTTVSPTYSQEVRGPEGGKGLHMTLTAHAHKFIGILNGIDTEAWNPVTDPLLKYQYSAEDLSGKAANKAALRASLGLDFQRPLVGCITRLVPQKGVHLIRHAIYRTLECGGQFILLGSSPISHIQREFEAIAHQFTNHPNIRLILKYDESLSHSIYAASDIFIIPSIFEPCGLTQMIAMRYGAIPVARKTGGLNDSVFDVDDDTIPLQRRNGFTFSVADEQGLNNALDRAMAYYTERSEWWVDLVRKAMKMDFSWESSAEQYEELYNKALVRAKSRV